MARRTENWPRSSPRRRLQYAVSGLKLASCRPGTGAAGRAFRPRRGLSPIAVATYSTPRFLEVRRRRSRRIGSLFTRRPRPRRLGIGGRGIADELRIHEHLVPE